MTIVRGGIALALGIALVLGCSRDSKETDEPAEESAEAAADEAAADEAAADEPFAALLRGDAPGEGGLAAFGADDAVAAAGDDESSMAGEAAQDHPSDAECTKLADHLMDIALREMAGQIPEDQRAMMEPMLVEAKREVIEQCAMFPAKVRTCMLAAETVKGLEMCATQAIDGAGGL